MSMNRAADTSKSRNVRRVTFVAGNPINNADGTVSLDFDVREMTQTEKEVIASLFPHCERQIAEMLETETVIRSIINAK